MCGRGVCVAVGVCGRGTVHGRGVCMAGGCVVGGVHGKGAYAWQEKTAIAVGSTHPTGMHSCIMLLPPANEDNVVGR